VVGRGGEPVVDLGDALQKGAVGSSGGMEWWDGGVAGRDSGTTAETRRFGIGGLALVLVLARAALRAHPLRVGRGGGDGVGTGRECGEANAG
jgi:hypothetical protein